MSEIFKMENSNERFTVFPIKYNNLWKFYKKHLSSFWTVEEVYLTNDLTDWKKLNDGERFFIKNILAFFSSADGIVNENLVLNFYKEIELPEARSFYAAQIMMESIHCVSPNTWVLTNKGYHQIKDMENLLVPVWNGDKFSNSVVKYTGVDVIVRVTLSNGMYLDCTLEHKWVLEDERISLTKDLKIGDCLLETDFPTLDLDDPFTLIDPMLYGERSGNVYGDNHVPINYSMKTKLKWLEGVNKKKQYGTNTNIEFLRKLQLMLTTMNIKVDIEGTQLVPRNGKKLKVVEISDSRRVSHTHCFNEPLKHRGTFNGILTGQSEMYSLLIDTYINDTEEKSTLFNAIDNIPAVQKKAEWAMKWIASDTYKFSQRILAFVCVEGIFFSGSFCAIYWLKNRGLMPGLSTSNEFISKDENLHTEFAIELYSMMSSERLSTDTVHTIFKEAVNIEKEFITESLPASLLGMNCALMSQYIEYVADRWLVMLEYPKLYNSQNPFPFMEMISIHTKENFFESRVTNYTRAGDKTITFDDDF